MSIPKTQKAEVHNVLFVHRPSAVMEPSQIAALRTRLKAALIPLYCQGRLGDSLCLPTNQQIDDVIILASSTSSEILASETLHLFEETCLRLIQEILEKQK